MNSKIGVFWLTVFLFVLYTNQVVAQQNSVSFDKGVVFVKGKLSKADNKDISNYLGSIITSLEENSSVEYKIVVSCLESFSQGGYSKSYNNVIKRLNKDFGAFRIEQKLIAEPQFEENYCYKIGVLISAISEKPK